MAKSDLSDFRLKVQFFERTLDRADGELEPGASGLGEWGTAGVRIERKYLYIFSSIGSDYGIARKTQGWEARTCATSGYQHTALLRCDAINPKPSGAPAPERVETEIYFDAAGRMWKLPIHGTWTKPRHGREHPKYGHRLPASEHDQRRRDEKLGPGAEWLDLHLVTKDGKPKLYYFLLVPFRLGPSALRAALEHRGVDGLSLLFLRTKARKDGHLVGPSPEDFTSGSAECRIGVVDPYAWGQWIADNLVRAKIHDYWTFLTETEIGHVEPEIGQVEQLHPSHLDARRNGGTVQDIYLLAAVLENLRHTDPDVDEALDHAALGHVLGTYGRRIEKLGNSCETAARNLANWMSGPAHAILDTAIVEDCEDASDPEAADIKAVALAYWHAQLAFLPNTATGAGFLTQIMSDEATKHPRPLRDLIVAPHEVAGKKLDPNSTTFGALQRNADIVFDICMLAHFRRKPEYLDASGRPDPSKLESKARATAALLNNLSLFDADFVVGEDARASAPEDRVGERPEARKPAKGREKELKSDSTKTKHEVKGVIAVVDAPEKFGGGISALYMKYPVVRFGDNWYRYGQQSTRISLKQKLGAILMKETELKQIAYSDSEWERRLALAVRRRANAKSIDDSRFYHDEISRLDKEIAATKAELKQLGVPPRSPRAMVEYMAKRQRLLAQLSSQENIKRAAEGVRDQRSVLARNEYQKLVEEHVLKSEEAGRSRRSLQESLGAVEKEEKELAKLKDLAKERVKAGISAAKVGVALMSALLETYFNAKTLGDRSASGREKAFAVASEFKALGDLCRDALKLGGAQDLNLSKLASLERYDAIATAMKNPFGSGLVTWCGVIAGVYNVGKYSIEGIDAEAMGDWSTVAGSGLAVAGGALTIWSSLGLGIGAALSASGVGAIAGILVIAGVLVVSFYRDSEWKWFAEHCYFARGSQRNTRPGLLGGDSRHYLGKMDSGRTQPSWWPVRSQLRVIERLMARFKIHSRTAAVGWKTDESSDVRWPVRLISILSIEFPILPRGSNLAVDINRDDTHPIRSFRLKGDQLGAGSQRIGTDRLAGEAQPGRPGAVMLVIDYSSDPFQRISVDVRLALDDAVISCEHTIVERSEANRTAASDPRNYTSKLFYNEDETIGDKFSNVRDLLPVL